MSNLKSETTRIPYDSHTSLQGLNLSLMLHSLPLDSLFFLPIGVLVARYRTTNRFWFDLHQSIQVFAGLLIIAGFAIGVNYTNEAYNGGITDVDHHKAIGVALFSLYLIQLVLGSIIHHIKPPRFPSANPFLSNRDSSSPPNPLLLRPPQNYVHAILGLVIIFLSFYQVRSGYKYMWPLWDGYQAPDGVNVVWILWLCIFCVVYVGGLALLRVQWSREKEGWMQKRENGDEEKDT